MARRKPYTKVERKNVDRPDHVKGKGDIVFKHFQCLNATCTNFISLNAVDLGEDYEFDFRCPSCNFHFKSSFEHKLFDYDVVWLDDDSTFSQGEFGVSHKDYVARAPCYKYCIVCYALKPVEAFDRHGSRASGRQGECRLCKQRYNTLKNATRITDQHREAAQKRRLYLSLSGEGRIDSDAIHQRFGFRCFKCDADLSGDIPASERPLDHTLPVRLLWPMTTETATLLCRTHNGEKSGKWPSEYYTDAELKRLAVITGVSYETLAGPAHVNPAAVERIQAPGFVDELLRKFAAYMTEMCKLRNRVLTAAGVDLFEHGNVAQRWVDDANAMLGDHGAVDDLENEQLDVDTLLEVMAQDVEEGDPQD